MVFNFLRSLHVAVKEDVFSSGECICKKSSEYEGPAELGVLLLNSPYFSKFTKHLFFHSRRGTLTGTLELWMSSCCQSSVLHSSRAHKTWTAGSGGHIWDPAHMCCWSPSLQCITAGARCSCFSSVSMILGILMVGDWSEKPNWQFITAITVAPQKPGWDNVAKSIY